MARLALVSALLSEWWSDISRTNFPTSPRIEKVQRNFAFQPGQRYWTALYSLPLTVSASLMEHWWSTLVPFLITTLFASCSYYVHFLFVYVQGFLFHFHFGLHLLLHHRDDTHTHTHTHTHTLVVAINLPVECLPKCPLFPLGISTSWHHCFRVLRFIYSIFIQNKMQSSKTTKAPHASDSEKTQKSAVADHVRRR